MCRRSSVVLLITLVFSVMTVSASYADRYTTSLTTNEITTITPKDSTRGEYYVVSLEVPEILKGKELLGAFMEIVIDVDARTVGDLKNQTPMLEVYGLNNTLTNELKQSDLATGTPTRRNIVVGNDRAVKLDITQIVKGYLADPTSNNGLVLGSLTNTRDGLFDIKSNGGRLATITYYFMAKEPE